MRKTKQISLFLVVLLLISNAGIQAPASATDVGGTRITAAGAIVMDVETGTILFEHNAYVRRAPASMTKMMTVYLVYEAIANGSIGFDTIVPISQYAADFSRQPGETNVPLNRTGRYTVDELLDVVIVMSAGGAAVALAELVGGSRNAFYRMMNNKVAEWGADAEFHSASGGSTHTRMTPHAMAVITRQSILEFPEMLEKTAMTSVTFRGRTYPSTNHLLGVYEGIDGFKTGTNSVARECFSGTAQRGDVRLVSVVMGSSSGRRFSDTTTLLNYGFAAMEEIGPTVNENQMVASIDPSVYLNGELLDFEAYFIEGRNYFRIRDVAYALRDTSARFNVEWDDETRSIVFTRGAEYTPIGNEMAGRSEELKMPEPGTARIVVDGLEFVFSVYMIEGSNFFWLRDIAETFGFGVSWDEETASIIMETW